MKNNESLTVLTNIVLVLFTFWLGLVVQDIVAQKNASASSALVNVDYLKAVKPDVDSLSAKYNLFLVDFVEVADQNLENPTKCEELVGNNDSIIWAYCSDVIKTTSQVMYYLDKDTIKNIKPDWAALYGMLEVHNFCNSDSSFLNNGQQRNDSASLRRLENQLKKAFSRTEFVSTFGPITNYKFQIQLLELYKGFYTNLISEDGYSIDNSQNVNFTVKAMLRASKIHSTLNRNCTYNQPTKNILKTLVSEPWLLLFVCIILVYLLTIHWFKRKKLIGENSIGPDNNDVRFVRLQEEIIDIDNRINSIENIEPELSQIQEETKKMDEKIKKMMTTINDLRFQQSRQASNPTTPANSNSSN